jgi:hypothetical protein
MYIRSTFIQKLAEVHINISNKLQRVLCPIKNKIKQFKTLKHLKKFEKKKKKKKKNKSGVCATHKAILGEAKAIRMGHRGGLATSKGQTLREIFI